MLKKEEVRTLLTQLESENVERTRAFDKVEKMGQAISAFANDLSGRGKPGYLLLGVEDDGRISGARITEKLYASLGGLKTDGNILPPPSMSIELFKFDEGDVVVVEVFPSSYPPIRFKGQVWVRVGPRKSIATAEDIHLLEERRLRNGLRFEEYPCATARFEDLDVDLFLNGYLPKAIAAEVIDEDNRSVKEQLASLRFFDRNKGCPTNLGMILFGKHPESFVPSSYMQYVKFDGDDNGCDILAQHEFKGPLVRTVGEMETFAKTALCVKRPVLVSSLREAMIARYPDWAIRELLFNALIHRDYGIGNAPIKLYEYANVRLELSNPGGLFGQARPENFPYVSDYRNPLLAEALKILGFVNKFNRGIAKVKTELQKNGNPPPVFDVNKLTEFRVTLCPSVGEINSEVGTINGTINGMINGTINGEVGTINGENGGINGGIKATNDEIGTINAKSGTINGEIKIKAIIGLKPGIKREGLLLETKIPLRTIARILQRLKQQGVVEYRGSKRTGGWFPRT